MKDGIHGNREQVEELSADRILSNYMTKRKPKMMEKSILEKSKMDMSEKRLKNIYNYVFPMERKAII